ncbi:MAG TPA: hypothetical protein VHV51_08015 [Polyangiaceae bacterium]|jgi:hypothetical protein|nr:hypothetical protein [Polyangiaceae bacterium]
MKAAAKKVTVTVPTALLERARSITKGGVTETIITALSELERQRQRSLLRDLRGKVRIELDLARTRR